MIECGLFVVLSDFLEGGEVVFNGVQVRGIGRKKEQRGSRAGNERCGLGAFVEGDLVQDHDMSSVEEGAEGFPQPGSEELRVAGSLKHHWGCKGLADPCGDQQGPWPAVARDHPVNALSSGGVDRAAGDGGGKAAFIQVYQLLATRR